ncbi:hypothetical protein SO802_000077 [Lithocarpus litseifolius]|uniref:Uncharacterized protein n=1 Tax=Lithocarpus litseifolius TaxID=425828 RepID=A0AAW2DQX2_9ROSI
MENSASREIQLEITGSASIRTSTECRIYKVPYHLRKWNEEAYTPQVISIGPIHHGNNKFQTMEKHKERCFESLKQRTGITLEDFERDIRPMENSIRQCYVETVVDLGSDDFVKMIMLDVSFILELFLKFNSESWPREYPLLVEAWLLDTVFRDLLLLENQLPFFVIEKLFNLAFPYGSNNRSLIQLTFDFFKTLNIYDRTPISIANEEIKHFTDLLRAFQLPESSKLPYRGPDTTFPKYSATQLHEAGVKFTKAPTKSQLNEAGAKFTKARTTSVLDLDFKNGELEIPTLTFEDGMEDLVRNIMALEQCNIRLDTYFTDFYIILDHLIDTTKDVELLIKKGIIVNCLGDSETVTSMINKLNRGIIRRGMNANYFNLCEKLNAFAEGFWNRNKAKLIRQYFNSPWKGTATIAAFIILALTLLQTIFTIKSSIGPKRV